MTTFKNLFRLRRHEMVERDVLDELFAMERGTLITLMLLETILLYILMPLLGKAIAAWYGIAISMSLWRYYNAYDYQKHPKRNLPIVWHKKLIVQVWLTALLFSMLALFAMPRLDAYYQLFVFIVLVGISSGAVKALARDHRTAVGYLTIMLLPLSVEMLLLMREDTYILAFLVVIYYFTQMNIILRSYNQFITLKRNEKEIAAAKAKLHEKQEMMQRFFEQATEGIVSYDTEMKILDCNDSFAELFDKKQEDLIGLRFVDLPNKNFDRIAKESIDGKTGTYNGLHYRQNENELWVEAKFSPLHDHKGNIVGGMGLVVDRTSEHMAQQELEYLVFHDPLTAISNRRGFRQFMSDMIKKNEHTKYYSLLYYLDLNKFKQINDIFGHETGDKVLIEAVHRLKRLSDDTCNLTRLGGDEFCIVVPFVGTVLDEVMLIMEKWIDRIEDSFIRPFLIDGRILEAGCSIGVVVIEPNSKNIDEIVHKADISMLHAKKNRERHVVVYDSNMRQKYTDLYGIQDDLKNAVKYNQFELYFQPIVDIESGRLYAAEALIRWNNAKKGVISPEDFLPVATKLGLSVEIDEWAIDNACRTVSIWKRDDNFNLKYLSVNIDAKTLFKKDFVESLLERLNHYDIKGRDIRLEITENSLIDSFENARRVIDELAHNGIECIIDDFGTGYSSLSYLKKLSFGTLKIDREFTKDLLDGIENVFLVRTIIEMGERLHYQIVVEGIETEKQRRILSHINKNLYYQGHLSSPPLPLGEFNEKIMSAVAGK